MNDENGKQSSIEEVTMDAEMTLTSVMRRKPPKTRRKQSNGMAGEKWGERLRTEKQNESNWLLQIDWSVQGR